MRHRKEGYINIMKKNNLTIIFSQVCQRIADNITDLLVDNLNPDDLMITPLFEDAAITNIDEWWKTNEHFAKYTAQIHGLARDMPDSMQENIDMGIAEIQESETLWEQLRGLDDASESAQLTSLKHIPHNAQYASELMETDGYKALDRVCEKIGNVVAWPMVTIDADALDLKSAFCLNVAIVSTDERPLKQKLESFAKLTF
jgi:hypothetical protein